MKRIFLLALGFFLFSLFVAVPSQQALDYECHCYRPGAADSGMNRIICDDFSGEFFCPTVDMACFEDAGAQPISLGNGNRAIGVRCAKPTVDQTATCTCNEPNGTSSENRTGQGNNVKCTLNTSKGTVTLDGFCNNTSQACYNTPGKPVQNLTNPFPGNPKTGVTCVPPNQAPNAGEGESCVVRTGESEQGNCASNFYCQSSCSGQGCRQNTQTGICAVAGPKIGETCTKDSSGNQNCRTGLTCNTDQVNAPSGTGICVPDVCNSNRTGSQKCPAPFECHIGTTQNGQGTTVDNGTCIISKNGSTCVNQSECGDGYTCALLTTTSKVCVPNSCRTTSCPTGFNCVSGSRGTFACQNTVNCSCTGESSFSCSNGTQTEENIACEGETDRCENSSSATYRQDNVFDGQTLNGIQCKSEEERLDELTPEEKEELTKPPCEVWENGVCLEIDTAFGKIKTNPGDFVVQAFLVLLPAGGGIAVLLLMRAGYRIMTSRGNPEGLKEGNEQIVAAILGLMFLILSFLLLQIIGVDLLRLPGFS